MRIKLSSPPIEPTLGDIAVRTIAYLIDTVIVLLLSLLATVLLGAAPLNFPDLSKLAEMLSMWLYFHIFTFVAYFTLLEGLFGRTVGKALLGLRVVAVDGKEMGLMKAFTRTVFRILDGILIYIPAFLWWQRIGDMAAGTVVLRRKTQIHLMPQVNLTHEMYVTVRLERDRRIELLRLAKEGRVELPRKIVNKIYSELEELEDFLVSSRVVEYTDPYSYSRYYALLSKMSRLRIPTPPT